MLIIFNPKKGLASNPTLWDWGDAVVPPFNLITYQPALQILYFIAYITHLSKIITCFDMYS